ncbi:cupin domain-containing protein [Actinomycetospora sp. TBRC 11914]|uniref:cupin domain-containing protein n=1 Tax=Actinomycetospora sp. TBRC 11914 TaxID=2729387 RepID=UPI00145D9B7C|nr:cupin domain-containing protein [Actinomycetospora sp. TBRC 11914]NMO91817.1 cupin domain-containing protein [Actinomycetospora sp. TBRC 11914]
MSADEAAGPRVIPYAGDTIRVLGESEGIAFCELTVPPHFAGPPPHIHHGFDEALYVLSGALTMVKDRADPEPVPVGGLILAPRGVRHTFANPHDEPARVVGVWSPASALEFMAEIGAALPASGPPDPERLAAIYRRHDGEIVP